VFPARLDGDNLILEGSKPQTRFNLKPDKLPASIIPGLKRRQKVVLQAVTLGSKTTRWTKKRRKISDRFLWHGLAAETAESLAEWCSRTAAGEMGWKEWRRVSSGYPSWPELAEQSRLFRLLRPRRIGLSLSRSFQMIPEYSTSAVLFPT
jgi:cobalamin-dependent methionine synthase I